VVAGRLRPFREGRPLRQVFDDVEEFGSVVALLNVDRSGLIDALNDHPLVHHGLVPGEDQMALVQRFADYYEESGLIVSGEAPPLRSCCANGEYCWREANPTDVGGSLSLPWVGPDYRPGGVLILGINFNDAYGIAEAFALAHWELRNFARGRKRMTYDSPGYRGSDFAYRSTRSAGLLIDVLDGVDVTDRERSEELVAVLNRVVRLQTIKCSPENDALSKPTGGMWENCPPMLLADEFAIARPRFIVAFGGDVRWALERLPGFSPEPAQEERLHCGVFAVGGTSAGVFMLDHPRSRYWPASHASLVTHLQR
jgi:hypothetical protein